MIVFFITIAVAICVSLYGLAISVAQSNVNQDTNEDSNG